jgi:hypothetical protein
MGFKPKYAQGFLILSHATSAPLPCPNSRMNEDMPAPHIKQNARHSLLLVVLTVSAEAIVPAVATISAKNSVPAIPTVSAVSAVLVVILAILVVDVDDHID